MFLLLFTKRYMMWLAVLPFLHEDNIFPFIIFVIV